MGGTENRVSRLVNNGTENKTHHLPPRLLDKSDYLRIAITVVCIFSHFVSLETTRNEKHWHLYQQIRI